MLLGFELGPIASRRLAHMQISPHLKKTRPLLRSLAYFLDRFLKTKFNNIILGITVDATYFHFLFLVNHE